MLKIIWLNMKCLYLLIVIFCCYLATACTQAVDTSPAFDGPPDFALDISQIHNPIPHQLTKSRGCNPKSYTVLGKKYNVLKSNVNYDRTGIASWYGVKFHGHKTACGDYFDMFDMTAAHKTLPLPTYAYIYNLDNHRRIIVKINDRGPFHGNRIIDLSYAAAAKLGVLHNGTAHVRVKTINFIAHNSEYSLRKSTSHKNLLATKIPSKKLATTLYLQLGVFSSMKRALHKMEKTRILFDKQTVKISKILKPNKKLYRVFIGPLNTNSLQLNRIKHKLHHHNIAFVHIKTLV